MYSFKGSALILDDVPKTIVYTDACDQAGGGHCEGDWFYCNWSVDVPEIQDFHINVKELMAVIIATRHWCHLWTNKRVLVMSDNSMIVAGVNRGSSRSPVIMKYLRYMFWLSAVYNFRLTAMHIPGADNVLADKISRLHEPYSRHNLSMLLPLNLWHGTCLSMRLFVSWTGPDFLRSLNVKVHWLQGQVFAPSTRLIRMHLSASCTCVFL